ncbi:hypothetical protein P9112_006925 [Eukaryota sp. TZLM1-RC]
MLSRFFSRFFSSPEAVVKSISIDEHILVLLNNGDVYSWGKNSYSQVLWGGPSLVTFPVRIPISRAVSVSAGEGHSLVLLDDGRVIGWGRNGSHQLKPSSDEELPLSELDIPFEIDSVYAGRFCSFALTQQGHVVHWGLRRPFTIIEGLLNIQSLSGCEDQIVCLDSVGDVSIVRPGTSGCDIEWIPLLKAKSVSISQSHVVVLDVRRNIWSIPLRGRRRPTKALTHVNNIKAIAAGDFFFIALLSNGSVHGCGALSRLTPTLSNSKSLVAISRLSDILSISLDHHCLIAVNHSCVFGLGRNCYDIFGRKELRVPQQVAIFNQFFPKRNRQGKTIIRPLFSVLVNIILTHYLNFLLRFFEFHVYVRALFTFRCRVSKRLARLADEVLNSFPIRQVLVNPKTIHLADSEEKLKIRLNSKFKDSIVPHPNITKLWLHTNHFKRDETILESFPKLHFLNISDTSSLYYNDQPLDLSCFQNLVGLELHNILDQFPLLPPLLRSLEINSVNHGVQFIDLRFLNRLEALTVHCSAFSQRILNANVALPSSILSLNLSADLEAIGEKVFLPNLKELLLSSSYSGHLLESNFPCLDFLLFRSSGVSRHETCSLCPLVLSENKAIQSILPVKTGGFLVQLNGFPKWIQYPLTDELADFFNSLHFQF